MRVVIRSAAVAVLFLVTAGCGSTSPDEPETGENLPPLSISTESLASGHVGAPYQQPLAASGGVKPYGWSLGSRSAELAWLRVDPISGALSGNPSKAVSSASVSVVVTDQRGVTTSRDFAITIEACKAGDTLRCHVGTAEGCQIGTLACDSGAYPGTCDGVPSNSMRECGPDCGACGADADSCTNGNCTCGANPACGAGQLCCKGACHRAARPANAAGASPAASTAASTARNRSA